MGKLNKLSLFAFSAAVEVASIAAPVRALAWGELGHEIIAQIADDILTAQAPQTLRAIAGTVGVEPLYLSSTWPDQVRSSEMYRPFAPYHFFDGDVERPATAGGKTAWTVLFKYPRLIPDVSIDQSTRMTAYRYLVHVIGDVHQPLHVGIRGDYGGGNCSVVWTQLNGRADRTDLHKVWDGPVVYAISDRLRSLGKVKSKYDTFKEISIALRDAYPERVRELPRIDFKEWLRESRALVLSDIYPDRLPPDQREYCKRAAQGEPRPRPVDLGPAYTEKAMKIAEERLVLGGVRLAAVLKEVFSAAPGGADPNVMLDQLKLQDD